MKLHAASLLHCEELSTTKKLNHLKMAKKTLQHLSMEKDYCYSNKQSIHFSSTAQAIV